MGFYLFLFAGFGLFIWFLYWRITNLKKIKEAYDKALKSSDKNQALEAGRRYYRSIRGGNLTIYDEQAIANDLNAMKQEK